MMRETSHSFALRIDGCLHLIKFYNGGGIKTEMSVFRINEDGNPLPIMIDCPLELSCWSTLNNLPKNRIKEVCRDNIKVPNREDVIIPQKSVAFSHAGTYYLVKILKKDQQGLSVNFFHPYTNRLSKVRIPLSSNFDHNYSKKNPDLIKLFIEYLPFAPPKISQHRCTDTAKPQSFSVIENQVPESVEEIRSEHIPSDLTTGKGVTESFPMSPAAEVEEEDFSNENKGPSNSVRPVEGPPSEVDESIGGIQMRSEGLAPEILEPSPPDKRQKSISQTKAGPQSPKLRSVLSNGRIKERQEVPGENSKTTPRKFNPTQPVLAPNQSPKTRYAELERFEKRKIRPTKPVPPEQKTRLFASTVLHETKARPPLTKRNSAPQMPTKESPKLRKAKTALKLVEDDLPSRSQEILKTLSSIENLQAVYKEACIPTAPPPHTKTSFSTRRFADKPEIVSVPEQCVTENRASAEQHPESNSLEHWLGNIFDQISTKEGRAVDKKKSSKAKTRPNAPRFLQQKTAARTSRVKPLRLSNQLGSSTFSKPFKPNQSTSPRAQSLWAASQSKKHEQMFPDIAERPSYVNNVSLYATLPYHAKTYKAKMARSQKILLHPQPVRSSWQKINPQQSQSLWSTRGGNMGPAINKKNKEREKKKKKKGLSPKKHLMKDLQHVESGRPLPWNTNYQELLKNTISEGSLRSPEHDNRKAVYMVPANYPDGVEGDYEQHLASQFTNHEGFLPSPESNSIADGDETFFDDFSSFHQSSRKEEADLSKYFSSQSLFKETKLRGGLRSREMVKDFNTVRKASKSAGSSVRKGYLLRKRQVELGLLDPTSARFSPAFADDSNELNDEQSASGGWGPLSFQTFVPYHMGGFVEPAIDVDWKNRKLNDILIAEQACKDLLYPVIVNGDEAAFEKALKTVVMLLKGVGDDLAWPQSERKAFIDLRSSGSFADYAELVSKLNQLLSIHKQLEKSLEMILEREDLLKNLSALGDFSGFGDSNYNKDAELRLENINKHLRENLPTLHQSMTWLNGIIYDGEIYLHELQSPLVVGEDS